MTTPKQPTEAEINGALLQAFQAGEAYQNECFCGNCDYCIDHTGEKAKPFHEWVKSIPWLQNYQAQPQPNAISVIEERIKQLEQKLNEENSKKFDDTLSFMAKVSENCRLIYALCNYRLRINFNQTKETTMKVKHIKIAPVFGIGYWKDTYNLDTIIGYTHNFIFLFLRIQVGELKQTGKRPSGFN